MTLLDNKKIIPQTALVKTSASLTGSFVLVGTLPGPSPSTNIINASSTAIEYSFDGTNIHGAAAVNGVTPIGPISSGEEIGALPAGTSIYMRGTAGTGSIYVTSLTISKGVQ
jgi:hypothetical protein